jgi:hypothetical protein
VLPHCLGLVNLRSGSHYRGMYHFGLRRVGTRCFFAYFPLDPFSSSLQTVQQTSWECKPCTLRYLYI